MSDSMAYDPSEASAAETLRAVEGLRRRTERLMRPRATPFWIWSALYLAAVPFAFIGEIAASLAAGLAAIMAGTATLVDHRRQPVHRAKPARSVSVAGAIIIGAVVLLVGPMLIGMFFLIVISGLFAFILGGVGAVVNGRIIGNDRLGVWGVIALTGTALSMFAWTDHWEVLALGIHAMAFLAGGLFARASERRVT